MDTENQKKIWVAAFCACIADPGSTISGASAFADMSVDRYVKRFAPDKQEAIKPVETSPLTGGPYNARSQQLSDLGRQFT